MRYILSLLIYLIFTNYCFSSILLSHKASYNLTLERKNNNSLSNFYLSLILVGLGWNFGFIGSTSLLTKHHSFLEKGKIQGLNDFCIFGFVALASLTSGFLMNCSSSSAELGWQLINLAATPFIALAIISVLFLRILNRPFKAQ